MRYKRISVVFAVLSLLSVVAVPRLVAQQRQAEVLLQRAMNAEQVAGDLEQAIALYRQVLADHADVRPVAARALLRLGLCYENLGRDEATNAYERLLRDYADQSEMAVEARVRLAALRLAETTSRGPVARMLLSSVDLTDGQFENPRLIVPSPDGRRVGYYQSGPETKGEYIRDLATGDVQQIASGPPTVNYLPPAWSADGKRLAFSETDADTKVSVIRIVDLSSREMRTVPVPDGRRPYLVDWTRDGRYLLCNDLNGNSLHLVAVGDGTMTMVSDSVWPWQRATFSPDGRFVAYGAGSHGHESLYVQPVAGGSRHRIAESGGEMYLHPLWSPDGSAIAHQQADGIWVVPIADGEASGAPRLAYRTESPRWAAAWTAAGGLHFTAFEQRNVPMQVEVDPGTGRAAGSAAQELAEYPDPAGMQTFRWSSDRRRVAITGWGNDLTVYSIDTKASTSYDPVEAEGVVFGGVWSPDGRELWYQYGQPTLGGSSMKALDLTSGRVREVFPPMGGRAGMFSLSADGRTMAFLRPGTDGRSVEIVVAETGQTDGRVVTTLPGPDGIPMNTQAMPQLSPRGDQVVYALQRAASTAAASASDAGSLWVVGSDGTGARRLTTATFIISAMWDPSGKFIAYTGTTTDTTDTVLRVVDVATGREHGIPLPSTRNRLQINDWSQDGRFIGLVRSDVWWEYWAVQGLQEGGR